MSWSAKYQEWFGISSSSLQPLNTHTHAPSGDAPGYVPMELRMNTGRKAEQEDDLDDESSKRTQRLRKRSKSSSMWTGAKSDIEEEERNAAVSASAGFEFDEGDDNEDIVSDTDEKEQAGKRLFRRRRWGKTTRFAADGSPIVLRRKKATKVVTKESYAKIRAKQSAESWVEGGRWDTAALGCSRKTRDASDSNIPDDSGLISVAAAEALGKLATRLRRMPPESPVGTQKRKRPSKNLPAMQAAAAAEKADWKAVPLTRKTMGSGQTSGLATCDGCGEMMSFITTGDTSLVTVHPDSPGRTLCDICVQRQVYLRSRAKMGTVVARAIGRRSPSVSPVSRGHSSRSKKLFHEYDFAFLDDSSTTSAAASAARDLLARQVRSCGGTLVNLTTKYARELDPLKSRLICLASAPENSTQYLLALAIGAVPLSFEWPTRAMQAEKLVPTVSYQLKSLRVPGCAELHGQYGQLGQVLPIERRVLRTAKGKDPLLMGVKASEDFTQEWEPLLRAAGAQVIPIVASSVSSKQPRVHVYLCDGTTMPSAGSRVPCVSLAWLVASLVSQRRKGFKDHSSFGPPQGVLSASTASGLTAAAYDFQEPEQNEWSQRF
jgi:hypothetical protein